MDTDTSRELAQTVASLQRKHKWMVTLMLATAATALYAAVGPCGLAPAEPIKPSALTISDDAGVSGIELKGSQVRVWDKTGTVTIGVNEGEPVINLMSGDGGFIGIEVIGGKLAIIRPVHKYSSVMSTKIIE